MRKYTFILYYGLFINLNYSSALEYNKQRLNANTDFLLHEVGVQPSAPNNNYNGAKRDYVAEFPSLGPYVTPKTTSTTAFSSVSTKAQSIPQSSNGKRDYVAPQHPTQKPVPTSPSVTSTTALNKDNSRTQGNTQAGSGKRDYVAPQYPTLKPIHAGSSVIPNPDVNKDSSRNQGPQSSNGKRDYVAPHSTHNSKPAQSNEPSQTGGKVKDLINFYDSKNNNQGTPSYSSILQGPGKGSTTTLAQPLATTSPIQPTKPMSFSSVVAGHNKPQNSNGAQVHTTSRPTTHGSRGGTHTLPSSVVSNNRVTNANDNTVSDAELQILSEELLRKDTNNAARYITVNYQGKTTSLSKDDRAPGPLLTIAPEAWNIPTIQKFVPLLDNYERDAFVNEHVTPQERIEENDFMDAVMSTTVMRHLMNFLKTKGYVSPDPRQQRDFVKQLWFTLYSRGKGKLGSSGFEHIFVAELKNGGVSGFHNWVYFSREEAVNRVNYLGYLKYSEFNDKGAVLKFHINHQGVDKPVTSMFIGTSPELELALYTLCYVTRLENDCNLKLGNKDVRIVTYNYRYRSKNLIGSAYPEI